MKFKTFDGSAEIELLPCPFCGGDPVMDYIGNDHSRRRKIVIKCGDCRAARTDAAIKHPFRWLEKISVDGWNQRALSNPPALPES